MSTGTTIRRLMKEAQELSPASSSPSPYFHAHPISDSNLFDWHFTLAGPPEPSPYANGIYHGRIILPPQYPLRPPSFRFLTPSGRFEVNREICLSISGHHEQTWQPAWGIRTALTALRSFMDGDAKGQVGGLDATNETRREWAKRSRTWKCPTCADGKTNHEILTEWQALCRDNGANVDQEDRPGHDGSKSLVEIPIPSGLKLGYRDEMEKAANPSPNITPSRQTDKSLNRTESRETTEPASIITASATMSRGSPNPEILSPAYPNNVPDRRQQQRPAAQVPPTTVATATDGPWLDRAIAGVVIALLVMILRKIIYAPAV